jgi:hypothetical protein
VNKNESDSFTIKMDLGFKKRKESEIRTLRLLRAHQYQQESPHELSAPFQPSATLKVHRRPAIKRG